MLFYAYEWVFAAVFAFSFLVFGKHDAREGMEKDHGWLMALGSWIVSAVVITWITTTLWGMLFFQLAYFVFIAVLRVWWEDRQS
ncbi:MAG: hypothetical protein MI750_04255 [Xanthomonadales bacterium]|jgi:hypothetical protein|nr:hypothetical protein [Xanthomonadales bacterium]